MNGRAHVPDPMSGKGWVEIGFDKNLWIPCPPEFGERLSRDEWAAGFANTWWDASGRKHGRRVVNAFARMLIDTRARMYAEQPCHLGLLHLPDVQYTPLPVYIGIWQAVGDREAQLRELVHCDEPAAVERPLVEEAWTESLGTGLRSLYYQRPQRRRDLLGVVHYAWRSEEYETALHVYTLYSDLRRLQSSLPDIDAMTRTITFVPGSRRAEEESA
jgi:hypothetical protein